MIRDITLGQYYATDSPIHRLDPRVKIIGTFLFIVELFLVHYLWVFGLCAFALAVTVILSKVPFSFMMRGMKPVLFILVLTFFINMFMIQGRILWQWKVFKITEEGLQTAVFMAIRLILLIVSSSLLTLTTKPLALTDGMERLLAPLSKIGVPTHEIAMMMSIALRFIPMLLEETDKIIKAQQARGADFESGNIIRRSKAMVPILVPLFVSSFHIAQDLANAMEARCYRGGKGRTRMNAIVMDRYDYLVLVLLGAFLALLLFIRIRFH